MKVHYPKLYNMAHLLALNVLLLPKDLTIIFIQSRLLVFGANMFQYAGFGLECFPAVRNTDGCWKAYGMIRPMLRT